MKSLHLFFLLLCSTQYIMTSSDARSSKSPVTIFCHGLGGDHRKEIPQLIKKKIIHQSARGFALNNNQKTCSLGHEPDVQALDNAINKKEPYIVYGRSRGGFTALNHFVDKKPDNIQALILDAAPFDMLNMVDEYQYQCGIFLFWKRSHKEWIMRQFYPGYPTNQIPPLQKLKSSHDAIIKKTPIFIGHSQADRRVNIRSAFQNYKALRELGFNNVYVCHLPQGSHHRNYQDPDYQKALHSFYKKHELPHDEQLATLDDLSSLQPTIEEINQKIYANQWILRRQSMINLALLTSVGIYLIKQRWSSSR